MIYAELWLATNYKRDSSDVVKRFGRVGWRVFCR